VDKIGAERRGAGKRHSPRRSSKTRVDLSHPSPLPSDLMDILGNFAQAISLTVVCQRSLAAQEVAAAGDEEEALREAIRMLKRVYNELDRAAGAGPA
jgi:hypothetical protein